MAHHEGQRPAHHDEHAALNIPYPTPAQLTITPERWLPIPGAEGFYDASDLGRIRSVDRTTVDRLGRTRRRNGRVLKLSTDRDGYQKINLSIHGQRRTRKVHQLVLEAHRGPIPAGLEVLHGNGRVSDNRLCNLSYGTRSQNVLDSVRHGTHSSAAKTHCPRGHRLVEPNLVPFHREQGKRACLACAKASNFLSKRNLLGTAGAESKRWNIAMVDFWFMMANAGTPHHCWTSKPGTQTGTSLTAA